MNFKKLFTLGFIILFGASSTFAGESVTFNGSTQLKSGISAYKSGDYMGCLQKMLEVLADDPSNTMAHYYVGMSNAQLGERNKAILSYQKVIALNTNKKLTDLAMSGIDALHEKKIVNTMSDYKTPLDRDVDYLYGKNKYITNDIEKDIKELNLEILRHDCNHRAEVEYKVIQQKQAQDPKKKQ